MYLAAVLEILSLILSRILPVELSFENGLIENLQVIVLIAGAIFSLSLFFQTRDARLKWFQIFCAAAFLLVAFRELSWGRVFFPIAQENFGPVFVDMKDYHFKMQVYFFIAVCGAAMLFILFKFIPVKKFLQCKFPTKIFAVLIVAIVCQYLGEHGYFLDRTTGQIFEELNELIAYSCFPAICLHYHKNFK